MKRIICTLATHGGDIAVTVFALACFAASFTGDAQVYAFPRLVSALMLAFCAMRFAQKIFAKSAVTSPTPDGAALLRLLPGAIVIILHIALARELGFYASSFLSFFALACIYARDRASTKTIITNAVAALSFTAALYALFSALLKVQTPSALLF